MHKKCPNDSPRTRTSGRAGPTFHVMEYGPLYRLVIPEENVDKWKVKTETKVELYDKNGTLLHKHECVVLCLFDSQVTRPTLQAALCLMGRVM